jgi:diadenosine tetraphosphate (Ap4A) HIT family hydrolase
MMDAAGECMLCRPEVADAFFARTRVWQNEHWRLSAVLQGPIAGFAHLETRRHVPFITDLDGAEAATLGPVLARVTRVLRDAAGAEKTYVYVFGDRIAHLHFNLAPHRGGDGLRGGPGLLDPDLPDVDSAVHQVVAAAVAQALADGSATGDGTTPSGSPG